MRAWRLCGLVAAAALGIAASEGQTPAVRITSPQADAVLTGATRLEAVVDPPDIESAVQAVTFTVNGRVACAIEQPPFACVWDAGEAVRAHHVRVVATLADGRRLTANVHTSGLTYAERVQTHAVLVPAIVTRGGQFVRGLKRQDFEIVEDGVRQTIASIAAEDGPLDLVLVIDISGSMEASLDQVKAAVKRLLSKLRPGDAVTLAGFNDALFLVAEREKDQQARERAVDLLSAWGSTALYDATVRAIDLVSRDFGRKGIVLFSDGDDRSSLTSPDAAARRVQESDAMLYTVGFGQADTVPSLRNQLTRYARATGGRAFFPRNVAELDEAFDQILTELASQYVLSYTPADPTPGDRWRGIRVNVRGGNVDVRARQGYRLRAPPRVGR